MDDKEFVRYLTEKVIEKYINTIDTSDDPDTVELATKLLDTKCNDYIHEYGEDYLVLREQRTQEDIDLLESERHTYIYQCAIPKLAVD